MKPNYITLRCPNCGEFAYKHTEKENLECEQAWHQEELGRGHFV